MTTLDILRSARALVARGWTQGAFARDASGNAVRPKDPCAIRWCADGAVRSVDPYPSAALAAMDRVLAPCDFVNWNDCPGRTQAEVLGAFDRAIESEERAAT